MSRCVTVLGALALVCAVAAAPAEGSLIVNGGFETGDFTGWTANPVSFSMYVDGTAHSGSYGAQIAGYSLYNHPDLWRSRHLVADCHDNLGRDVHAQFLAVCPRRRTSQEH